MVGSGRRPPRRFRSLQEREKSALNKSLYILACGCWSPLQHTTIVEIAFGILVYLRSTREREPRISRATQNYTIAIENVALRFSSRKFQKVLVRSTRSWNEVFCNMFYCTLSALFLFTTMTCIGPDSFTNACRDRAGCCIHISGTHSFPELVPFVWMLLTESTKTPRILVH